MNINSSVTGRTVKYPSVRIPDQSKLRPYQKECIQKIEDCEKGSYLIVLPTGAGKTFCFSHIPRHGRVLILSHRDELVRQPEKYYVNEKVFDINGNELEKATYGIEKAAEHSNGEEIVSASVPSLVRRLNKFDPYDFDVIITDECHHSTAPSYKKIYDYFKPRLHVGFTATPDRNDKADLHEIYDKILYLRDMSWGIKEGFLTDINCYQVDIKYDISSVKTQMGDWITSSLSDALTKGECISAVAEAYKKYRKGQTVIFAVSVAHANALAAKIEGSKVITGKTPPQERAQILKDFEDRKFPCLINVFVLTEGTDIPLIKTVIMARPTKNQSLYCQCIGRGLRPYPGKEALTLIDCVGVSKTPPVNVGHLFGLDIEVVPPKKRNKFQGIRITNMREEIEKSLDTPDSWIDTVRRVNLFIDNNNVNLRDIAFNTTGDNSLILSLPKCSLFIADSDARGESNLVIKTDTKKFIYDKKPLQDVIDDTYYWLVENKPDERAIWDNNVVNKWGNAPASVKQKNFVKTLAMRKKVDISSIDMNILTKVQASALIDRLMLE